MKSYPVISITSFLSESQKQQSVEINLPNERLESIDDIGACSKLKKINFSNNSLTQFKEINKCRLLSWINLAHNKIAVMDPLSNLSQLTVLNISHNMISAISGLDSLVNLKALILNNNNISEISGLSNLKKLNTLVLSANNIKEIKGLEQLKELKKLSLSHNKIMSFKGLKNLELLFELKLNDNQIASLPEELKFNKFLRILDLGKNRIAKASDIESIRFLSKISNFNFAGNPLESTSDQENLATRLISLCPTIKIINNKVEGKKIPSLTSKEQRRHQNSEKSSKREKKKSTNESKGEMKGHGKSDISQSYKKDRKRDIDLDVKKKGSTVFEPAIEEEAPVALEKKRKLNNNEAKEIAWDQDTPRAKKKSKGGQVDELKASSKTKLPGEATLPDVPLNKVDASIAKKRKKSKQSKILEEVLTGAKPLSWD